MALKLTFFVVLCGACACAQLCPKQCDCDVDGGLNRATCEGQNIVDVQVGVPSAVQVYSLSRNAISELDNYCFKEAGYESIEVLNLSFNLIFWIGLHAFAGLQRLAHLDLAGNRLRYVPMDLFFETPQLQILDLSGNVFETLKNEPFLSHTKLQVLNLNDCRIKSLPSRMFSRLPNLRKLDLADNYMISLNTEVLRPLRKLERLELRNDYWSCDKSFIAVETWITARGIGYTKQCVTRPPKMFEKMILSTPPERVEVDVGDVWNMTAPKNESLPVLPIKELTWFQKIDEEFSASQAFVIGLELGLAIGIVCTYVWLRSSCRCGAVRRRADGMRARLLWAESPPAPRRLPPAARCDLAVRADAVRMPARGDTPPPPYHECRFNI